MKVFSKYPKQKWGDVWIGYHYIDHTTNHLHNAKLRKMYKSKRDRKEMRNSWNHNNKALDVYMTCRIAFCEKKGR